MPASDPRADALRLAVLPLVAAACVQLIGMAACAENAPMPHSDVVPLLTRESAWALSSGPLGVAAGTLVGTIAALTPLRRGLPPWVGMVSVWGPASLAILLAVPLAMYGQAGLVVWGASVLLTAAIAGTLSPRVAPRALYVVLPVLGFLAALAFTTLGSMAQQTAAEQRVEAERASAQATRAKARELLTPGNGARAESEGGRDPKLRLALVQELGPPRQGGRPPPALPLGDRQALVPLVERALAEVTERADIETAARAWGNLVAPDLAPRTAGTRLRTAAAAGLPQTPLAVALAAALTEGVKGGPLPGVGTDPTPDVGTVWPDALLAQLSTLYAAACEGPEAPPWPLDTNMQVFGRESMVATPKGGLAQHLERIDVCDSAREAGLQALLQDIGRFEGHACATTADTSGCEASGWKALPPSELAALESAVDRWRERPAMVSPISRVATVLRSLGIPSRIATTP